MNNPLNMVIFGTGAMATLFGTRLTRLNKLNVTLFGSWIEQIKSIQKNGIQITHLNGTQSTIAINITNNPHNLKPIDIALVLVKSWQTEQTGQQISSLLKDDGFVLTLQNGIGNLEKLTSSIGQHRVGLGVTVIGAMITEPGHVKHTAEGPIHMAHHSNLESTSKLNLITSFFSESGFEVIFSNNMDSIIWGKLTINAVINPLTALLEIKNGQLCEKTIYQKVLSRIVKEVCNITKAKNITLPYKDPISEVKRICKLSANNNSSMLQDILRGSSTEIDVINGAIINEGRKLGIMTPFNDFLYFHVKQKQAGHKFDPQQLYQLLESN